MAQLPPTRSKNAEGKTVRVDPARDLASSMLARRELIVEILASVDGEAGEADVNGDSNSLVIVQVTTGVG